MHTYTISPGALERAQRTRGQLANEAPLIARCTALVVIHMQNTSLLAGAWAKYRPPVESSTR